MTDSTVTLARSILSTTVARWQQLSKTVPDALLARKPSEGEWSARECLQHVLDTERFVFPVRVRAFLAGQDFPGFDPETQGSADSAAPIAALVKEWARLRAESLALLAQVSEKDLARTARHGELGLVTLDQMLHEWSAHDLDHTMQAERSIMQPFILGCGPWRGYFRAQDISG